MLRAVSKAESAASWTVLPIVLSLCYLCAPPPLICGWALCPAWEALVKLGGLGKVGGEGGRWVKAEGKFLVSKVPQF